MLFSRPLPRELAPEPDLSPVAAYRRSVGVHFAFANTVVSIVRYSLTGLGFCIESPSTSEMVYIFKINVRSVHLVLQTNFTSHCRLSYLPFEMFYFLYAFSLFLGYAVGAGTETRGISVRISEAEASTRAQATDCHNVMVKAAQGNNSEYQIQNQV